MKIEDALQRFVENKEECVIYFDNGGTVEARVLETGEGFIIIDEKDSKSVVNIEHIMRVRSYPKNEKGKKKTVWM